MKLKKQPMLTLEDVWYRVEIEGLGYAISDYYGEKLNSVDEELNKQWAKTYKELEVLRIMIDKIGETLDGI